MPDLYDDMPVIDDQHNIGFIKRLFDFPSLKGMITSIKHYKPDSDGGYERDGIKYKLFDERSLENTLCDLGNALAAKIFADNTGTRPSHIAAGTTSGGKTSASTTLQVERARVALDSTTCPAAGAADDNVVTYVATFGPGVPAIEYGLVEAGLLNNAAGGTLICWADYGIITKGVGDIVIFTWTLTFGTT